MNERLRSEEGEHLEVAGESFADRVIRDGMEAGHKWAIKNGTHSQGETEFYEINNRIFTADGLVSEGEMGYGDVAELVEHLISKYPDKKEYLREKLSNSGALQAFVGLVGDRV